MNDSSRPLIGIDIGSAAVSVVVGEIEGDRLVVRGCGQARHDGARKGIIASLDEISEAVRVAAEEAEAMASVPVEIAYVGIGGMPIRGVPSTASVPVTGRDYTVTTEDLQRALAASAQVSIPRAMPLTTVIPSRARLPANRLACSSPYLEAVWDNFDDRETWTEELVTGRLFGKAWEGVRGWWSGSDPSPPEADGG